MELNELKIKVLVLNSGTCGGITIILLLCDVILLNDKNVNMTNIQSEYFYAYESSVYCGL